MTLPSAWAGEPFEASVVSTWEFNLSQILRKLLGAGTLRELKNRAAQVFFATFAFSAAPDDSRFATPAAHSPCWPRMHDLSAAAHLVTAWRIVRNSATDC